MLEADLTPQSHPKRAGLSVLANFGVSATLLGGVLIAANQQVFPPLGTHTLISLGLFAVISGLAARGIARGYPHSKLGPANQVTLTRAMMISFIAGFIAAPETNFAMFAIALLAFALDGLDGWLARKSGLASDFGARFDMEIDALFGAILALIAFSQTELGAIVLVLGFTRYAFWAASFALPWLNAPLPDSFARKAICVLQIASLIALTAPITPPQALFPIALIATSALLFSFGRDTLFLVKSNP